MSINNRAAAQNFDDATTDALITTANENPVGSTKATPEILASVEFEKHRGSWGLTTVNVPADLVAPLDDDEKITISEVNGGVRSPFCSDLILKRGSARKKHLHTRLPGSKHGTAMRLGATNAPGVPYEDWKTKRSDGLEYVHGFYADFDVEWVAEAFAAIERANELGIATDAHFTGSLGAVESGVGSGVVHKHAGLLDDKRRPLPYLKSIDGVDQITRATPEQVVAARRAEKSWHPAFAATIECVVHENGNPRVKATEETRKNADGTETTFTSYEYVVRHAPRVPLRVWFHYATPQPTKTEAEKQLLAKRNAKLLQLIAAPPYDKCVFNPNQPVFPNRGPIRPTSAHVENLPASLTFHNDGDLAYISGKGTGAINPGALDTLPEPDTPTWLDSRHAGRATRGARVSSQTSFVPADDYDELAILLMSNKAIRHGFMAATLTEFVDGLEGTETRNGLFEFDCITHEHNSAGRKQLWAKNGDPAKGVWPAFGCRDDNCTVHDGGALDNTARLSWLIGFSLKHGCISLEELLKECFADDVSRSAAAGIVRQWSGEEATNAAEPDAVVDWSQDQISKSLRRNRGVRAARRVQGGA